MIAKIEKSPKPYHWLTRIRIAVIARNHRHRKSKTKSLWNTEEQRKRRKQVKPFWSWHRRTAMAASLIQYG